MDMKEKLQALADSARERIETLIIWKLLTMCVWHISVKKES